MQHGQFTGGNSPWAARGTARQETEQMGRVQRGSWGLPIFTLPATVTATLTSGLFRVQAIWWWWQCLYHSVVSVPHSLNTAAAKWSELQMAQNLECENGKPLAATTALCSAYPLAYLPGSVSSRNPSCHSALHPFACLSCSPSGSLLANWLCCVVLQWLGGSEFAEATLAVVSSSDELAVPSCPRHLEFCSTITVLFTLNIYSGK